MDSLKQSDYKIIVKNMRKRGIGMKEQKYIIRMKEQQFIISKEQILDAVKYALKSNIKEHRIVDILMQDVEYIIEKVLPDECEKVQEESEE